MAARVGGWLVLALALAPGCYASHEAARCPGELPPGELCGGVDWYSSTPHEAMVRAHAERVCGLETCGCASPGGDPLYACLCDAFAVCAPTHLRMESGSCCPATVELNDWIVEPTPDGCVATHYVSLAMAIGSSRTLRVERCRSLSCGLELGRPVPIATDCDP